jgi:hypothetical protein
MFQALEITLQAEDQATKVASVDILLYIVEFLPTMVREYMLQQLTSSDHVSGFHNVCIKTSSLSVFIDFFCQRISIDSL